MEYIITFKNTNHAIKGEQCLLSRGLKVGVLPLPSQISAGCGISLRVSEKDRDAATDALKASGLDEFGLYSRETVNNKLVYTKIQ